MYKRLYSVHIYVPNSRLPCGFKSYATKMLLISVLISWFNIVKELEEQ